MPNDLDHAFDEQESARGYMLRDQPGWAAPLARIAALLFERATDDVGAECAEIIVEELPDSDVRRRPLEGVARSQAWTQRVREGDWLGRRARNARFSGPRKRRFPAGKRRTGTSITARTAFARLGRPELFLEVP